MVANTLFPVYVHDMRVQRMTADLDKQICVCLETILNVVRKLKLHMLIARTNGVGINHAKRL